jgi:hypothetical protein
MRYMKPIEEAQDLFEKFTLYLGTDIEGIAYYVNDLEAKRCANISVHLILDFISSNVVPYTYDKDSMKNLIANRQHYIKVLKEIEKL